MSTRRVESIISGQATSDGAGVELVRMIGQPGLPDLDPFLLLDAFRSDDPNDYISGFPAHPHRGFETVTYLLNGRMRHRDNNGNEGVIEPGGIQWMTAGSGIVHSEMPEQQDGMLAGYQLWINLPAAHKMTQPAYQEHDATQIPVETRAGALRGGSGNDPDAGTGASFEETLPERHSAFVQVVEGEISIIADEGSSTLRRDQLAVLGGGERVIVQTGAQAGRFLLIAGKPLDEPIARAGPFVMNTEAELRQAFSDYQSGKF